MAFAISALHWNVKKPVPASAPRSLSESVEVKPKSVESITPFPSESIIGDLINWTAFPVLVKDAIDELELPMVLTLN